MMSLSSSPTEPTKAKVTLTGELLGAASLVGGSVRQPLSFEGDPLFPPDVYRQRTAVIAKDRSSLISGFVILMVGGLMVAFQHFSADLMDYAPIYVMIRNVLVAAACILVTYNATRDGIGRGLLCVIFPPYLMLYATSQEESGWIRGLFLGVLLGLCAEAFLVPGLSLVLSLGPALNTFIEQVTSWIELASRPAF